MPMTENDLAAIHDVIHKTLDERDSIDRHTHRDHHRFISSLLKRREKNAELWEKIKSSVIGWLIIGFLSGLGWVGIMVYEGVKASMKASGH